METIPGNVEEQILTKTRELLIKPAHYNANLV